MARSFRLCRSAIQAGGPRPDRQPYRRATGAVVEVIAAALVAAEIVILFSGVVATYSTRRWWSDELASMLFLWLAMLGAVAFRR